MCRKMLYLLVLTLVLLTGCTSKINFDKNGISEETYNSTLALMERFNSNQFGEKIAEILKDFKNDDSDADEGIDAIEKEIKDSYYDLYNKCTLDNDKQMVAFGYNYSFLCTLKFRSDAMGVKNNYKESLDEYYQKFLKEPTVETFDDFSLYITKNNIFDYAFTINKHSLEEIATFVESECILFNGRIAIAHAYLGQGDMSEFYNAYCEAMDSLSAVVEDLNETPEFIEKFTSSDLDKIAKQVKESTACCKMLVDSYKKNPKSNEVGTYAMQMVDYLTTLTNFADEVSKNANSI